MSTDISLRQMRILQLDNQIAIKEEELKSKQDSEEKVVTDINVDINCPNCDAYITTKDDELISEEKYPRERWFRWVYNYYFNYTVDYDEDKWEILFNDLQNASIDAHLKWIIYDKTLSHQEMMNIYKLYPYPKLAIHRFNSVIVTKTKLEKFITCIKNGCACINRIKTWNENDPDICCVDGPE